MSFEVIRRRFLPPVATTAWSLANVPAWLEYCRALKRPASVQERLLLKYVRRNEETMFGRAHDFAGIRSVDDYRARVPLRRYEECEPFVRRIAKGEPRVLTADAVARLAVTSGSTSPVKLIPYTATLQAEYARAVASWMVDLYCARPQLAGGAASWSVTPRVQAPRLVNGVVPTGFDEDSRYLGGVAHRLVDAAMAVPGVVRELSDHETHRYVTLLFLLHARNLRLISVWHPSYLSLLLGALRTHWESLLADIRAGTLTPPEPLPNPVAAMLRRRLHADRARSDELHVAGPAAFRRLWPALRVVSCWGDAAARVPLDDLRRQLPGVFVQPKGLLATEAIVTLPFGGQGTGCAHTDGAMPEPERQCRPLAICSHFFEFVCADGRTSLAHELEPAATYEVIVTTGGGLYRYRLGDRVRVDGFVGRTPSLSFLGRDGQVSDCVGEKLHGTFVATVIAGLFDGDLPPRFAMLAPARTVAGVSYTLFVETDAELPSGISGRLEGALCQNPHYALAVDLRQLAPARVVRIRDGFQGFVRRSVVRGRRLGDVKPVALDLERGWVDVFASVVRGTTQ
jgi:hypothetical protein